MIHTDNISSIVDNTVTFATQGCGLVTSSYPASSVVQELVKDNPLAVDEQDYNLEVKVLLIHRY